MLRAHIQRHRAAFVLASLAAALWRPTRVLADAPALVPIQGYLTASDGTPIAGDRSLAFGVYDAASGGSLLYQETRTVSVVAGDFVVYLGEVTALPLSLFRDEEDLWLEVVIDGTDVVTPRTRLATGPYAGLAQYCEAADTLDGNDASDFALTLHSHSFSSLTSIPTGLSDGDDDGLGELSCSANQIPKRIGGVWACADDVDTDTDTLDGLSCSTGQLVQRTAGGYGCVTPATVATSGSYADLSGTPSGLLTGSGTAGYLPRYSAATTLANSVVYQSGSNVGVGNTGPNVRLDVSGEVAWGSGTRANRLGTAEGGSIELGDSSVGGSRPFIDFHFGNAMSEDFNVRVGNASDGELRVQADSFRMEAASGSGNVSMGHVANAITGATTSGTIGGGGAAGAGNANRVTDTGSTVGGGIGNRAGNDAGSADDAMYATVAGGNSNAANNLYATVGGGGRNNAVAEYATIAGGYLNAADLRSFVGGGSGNTLAAGGNSVIAGGQSNTGNGAWSSVIGGGSGNDVVEFYYSVVGGGSGNDASNAYYCVTGGGSANVIDADGATSNSYSVIGGGSNNSMTGNVGNTVIGGGNGNQVLSESYSAVIAGGNENTVVDFYGTVSGGSHNVVSGHAATIPGGSENSAPGQYAFAAGRRAKANGDGCFAWGDSTAADVTCAATNAWVARASGGVTFYSNAGMTAGVSLAAGGGSWTMLSDRALKRDVEPVDAQRVLAAVERMPIATWRYTTEASGARHMGPMAQDFHAAFGLGDDDKRIGSVDSDGVALAAVQGLGARTKAQAHELATLRREQSALRADVQTLRAQNTELLLRLERLEARGAGSAAGAVGYSWLEWGSTLLVGVAMVLGYRQRGRA